MTGLLFGIRLKGRKWDAPFSAFLLCLTVAEGEGPMHRAIGRGSQAVMNRAARLGYGKGRRVIGFQGRGILAKALAFP